MSLHETLARKHSWYDAWHRSPHATLLNFAILFAFVAVVVFALRAPFAAYNDQLAAAITAGSSAPAAHYVPGRLLVSFKPGTGSADQTSVLAAAGAKVDSTIPQIKTLILTVPVGAETKVRDALLHNPRVQVAELDYTVQPTLIPNDSLYPQQWYSKVIGAPAGWDISTGSPSVLIAVADTGLALHPDIAANVVPGFNVFANSTDTTDDPCSHGTAVASAAAEIGNNATGAAGMAWNVKVMGITVSDNTSKSTCGSTSLSYLAKAVTYAADHGARIINLSWGGTADDATLQSAVNYAWNKGAIIFAAAGNNGATPVMYPGAEQNVVAVGATQQSSTTPSGDTRANFSNYGSALDISAPGSVILAPFVALGNTSYSGWTGTSVASPIAAGLAALVLSVNPSLTNAQVVDLIEKNSDDLGTAGWDQYYGWGRIDVPKTLRAAGGVAPVTDTAAPTTSIASPVAGATVSGQITVAAVASDNVGVTKVELYKDGALYATAATAPYSFFWDTTAVSDGAHTLQAKAYDAAGNVGASGIVSVSVSNAAVTPTPTPTPTPVPSTNDTTAPTVTITSPKDGAKLKGNGSLTISVSATDASGVASITIAADGKTLNTCTAAASCSASWQGKSIPAGTHVITATATDASANANTAIASVTVTK